MHKTLLIERAPEQPFSEVLLKRTGQSDYLLENGRLLLTVKTEPAATIQIKSQPDQPKRWKEYRLYTTPPTNTVERYGKLVVAEEGHSTKEGETTRFDARLCDGAIAVWEAMGKIENVKQTLADLDLRVVTRIA